MEKWKQLLVVMVTSLLLIAFVAVCIQLGMRIHHTLLLFSLGILVAYALDPIVEVLRKTRVFGSKRTSTREFGITVLFVGLVLIFGFTVWLVQNRAIHEISAIQHHLPEYKVRAAQLAATIDQRAEARGMHLRAAEMLKHPPPEIASTSVSLARQGLPILGHILGGLAESIIVLLIAVYYLIFGHDMRRQFNGLMPVSVRERVDLWETDVNRILGSFVRGQLIIALVIGASAAVGCLALGIHSWLLIGIFVVIAALIPVFGPYIGVVPAVIAAVIGPTNVHNPVVAAVIVIIYFVIINEWGSKVLYPKLVGAALGLHPVLVLFVLFAGLEIAGVVGVLFAAPITALAIATIVHLYRYWLGLPDDLLSKKLEEEYLEEKAAATQKSAAAHK